MNVEQLQMILDAAQGAGESAFWIAIFWLGQGYMGSIITLIVFAVVAFTATKIVRELAFRHRKVKELDVWERMLMDGIATFIISNELGPRHDKARFEPLHNFDRTNVIQLMSEGLKARKDNSSV